MSNSALALFALDVAPRRRRCRANANEVLPFPLHVMLLIVNHIDDYKAKIEMKRVSKAMADLIDMPEAWLTKKSLTIAFLEQRELPASRRLQLLSRAAPCIMKRSWSMSIDDYAVNQDKFPLHLRFVVRTMLSLEHLSIIGHYGRLNRHRFRPLLDYLARQTSSFKLRHLQIEFGQSALSLELISKLIDQHKNTLTTYTDNTAYCEQTTRTTYALRSSVKPVTNALRNCEHLTAISLPMMCEAASEDYIKQLVDAVQDKPIIHLQLCSLLLMSQHVDILNAIQPRSLRTCEIYFSISPVNNGGQFFNWIDRAQLYSVEILTLHMEFAGHLVLWLSHVPLLCPSLKEYRLILYPMWIIDFTELVEALQQWLENTEQRTVFVQLQCHLPEHYRPNLKCQLAVIGQLSEEPAQEGEKTPIYHIVSMNNSVLRFQICDHTQDPFGT